MNPLSLFNSLLAILKRHQFRIPEPVMWLALILGGAAASAAVVSSAVVLLGPALALVLASIGGIVRWKYHRRRSRRGLVVALFAAGQGALDRQDEVKRLILQSLRDHLTEDEIRLVHSVPAVVGADDREFAIQLRKRLRARFLLHGRIAESDKGFSVYARVAQPTDKGVIHLDSITKDVTFERATWRHLINRLTAARDVVDAEYPLEFAKELEAVVRGTAGQLAEDQGDYQRAQRLLEMSLSVAPDSQSHQIDLIRVALARSILLGEQGEMKAIDVVRKRAKDCHAAPELHRSFAGLLFLCEKKLKDKYHKDALRSLRSAAEQRTDPQHALTVYNLAMETDNPRESAALADELLASKTHYRKAWYLHRQRGSMYWHEAKAAESQSEDPTQLFEKAAYHYTKAIRRRPHFKIHLAKWSFDYYGYRTPPLLYANASDAHRESGHRLRARWYYRRAERRRARLFAKADRAIRERQWARALAPLEQVAMVRGDDLKTIAGTFHSVALFQLKQNDDAEKLWRAVLASDPQALIWRAIMIEPPYGLTQDDLPGREPVSPDEVKRLIKKRTRTGSKF